MSDNVVKLLANNALCVDQAELGERIQALGARVAKGELGDVERVVVILDAGLPLPYRVYGRQCNTAELVGLLEYAKVAAMTPD